VTPLLTVLAVVGAWVLGSARMLLAWCVLSLVFGAGWIAAVAWCRRGCQALADAERDEMANEDDGCGHGNAA
jgi:hypothetical protein